MGDNKSVSFPNQHVPCVSERACTRVCVWVCTCRCVGVLRVCVCDIDSETRERARDSWVGERRETVRVE